MKISFYDYRTGLLSQFVQSIKCEDCTIVECSNDHLYDDTAFFNNSIDLILVHDEDVEIWKDLAAESGKDGLHKTHFVLVSTNPDELKQHCGHNEYLHCCLFPLDELKNCERVKRFFQQAIHHNRFDWDLLSLPPYPETLVAVYLSCIAKEKLPNLRLNDITYPDAQREYDEQWKRYFDENPGKWMGQWQNLPWNDAKQRGALKESLESLFREAQKASGGS